MSIKVEKIVYGTWGNCIRVSNGTTEIIATLDIGPRIIRCAAVGSENVFFEDTEGKITMDVSEKKWFNSDTWHIYGGHRFWVSPEASPTSYYPDNHPTPYEIKPNGVILKQGKQEFLNISLEMDITMGEEGEITVVHKLTNKGAYPIEVAPWALSVLAKGGMEVVPQTKRDTGLLGNAVLTLWSYTKMNDKRVYWGDDYIVLKQDVEADCAFKFGYTNEEGYAAYFVNNSLFIKKYNHLLEAKYPDFGVSFETYTNEHMLEMETLGELEIVAPEKCVEHTETWFVYGNVEAPSVDENEIKLILNKYI